MGKTYAAEPTNPTKSSKACGRDIRVHFKNTSQVCAAVRGLQLQKAKDYLEDVLKHKRCIPFRRFNGGVGRTKLAIREGNPSCQGRFPEKSIKVILNLLRNAESSAEAKGLIIENLYIQHIMANRAMRQRRRTYRAHGRINPFMASPCHVELILCEKEETIAAEPEDTATVGKREKRLRSGAKSAHA